VGKKNTWLWVFHHDLTALFLAHQTRARAAVEEVLGDWRPDAPRPAEGSPWRLSRALRADTRFGSSAGKEGRVSGVYGADV
jgi:hypothetical protein